MESIPQVFRDVANERIASDESSLSRRAADSTPTATDQLKSLREGFIERLWKGLLVLALFSAPLSASRSLTTGWLPLYTFHVGMALIVISVFIFRRRLSLDARVVLLLVIFWTLGLAGLLTFGPLGAGYWWLVLSSLIVSTIYSVRAGIMTVLAVTIVLLVVATGFMSGVLNMPHNPQAYGVSGVTWASMLLTTVATPFIVFQAIAAYQKTTLALLKEVEQQRDHIMQLANHDSLTGLPLMSLAMERLARVINNATRTKTKVAMLFIDLDGFKSVNDTAGHEAGDFVLRTIAFRIARSIRLSDTAARIGGDEFIVILGGLPDERIATEIAQRIISVVSQPIEYSNRQVRVGASIGIGLFPDHATDAQALRRAADAAMYTAKRRGKNSFTFAENVQLQAVMQAQRASGTSSQLGAAGG